MIRKCRIWTCIRNTVYDLYDFLCVATMRNVAVAKAYTFWHVGWLCPKNAFCNKNSKPPVEGHMKIIHTSHELVLKFHSWNDPTSKVHVLFFKAYILQNIIVTIFAVLQCTIINVVVNSLKWPFKTVIMKWRMKCFVKASVVDEVQFAEVLAFCPIIS